MTSTIGVQPYNKYGQLSEYSYNCIKYLMDNNEMLWRLLKYNTPDAWNRTNLTMDEKASLIYKGQEDLTTSRVFMDIRQPDVWVEEDCILRISPYRITPKNRTISVVTMSFEIYAHYKINTLSNYKTRIALGMQEILSTFNGSDIGGLGVLFFDYMRDQQDVLIQAGQLPYAGLQVFMSTNAA